METGEYSMSRVDQDKTIKYHIYLPYWQKQKVILTNALENDTKKIENKRTQYPPHSNRRVNLRQIINCTGKIRTREPRRKHRTSL